MKKVSRRLALGAVGCGFAYAATKKGGQEPLGLESRCSKTEAPETAFPVSSTGMEIIACLKEGNDRFAKGETFHGHQSTNWRMQLVPAQHPIATILGCSDSRVPPELVFDQGLGDLFVVRVAGNVVAPDVVGSLQYATEHLKTRLIVVLGHGGCGAVTAAVRSQAMQRREPSHIQELLKLIAPGLANLPDKGQEPDRIQQAVELNVRWSVTQLCQLADAAEAIEAGHLSIVGGVYDLNSGTVEFLT